MSDSYDVHFYRFDTYEVSWVGDDLELTLINNGKRQILEGAKAKSVLSEIKRKEAAAA